VVAGFTTFSITGAGAGFASGSGLTPETFVVSFTFSTRARLRCAFALPGSAASAAVYAAAASVNRPVCSSAMPRLF
jgi:hypothetical protein